MTPEQISKSVRQFSEALAGLVAALKEFTVAVSRAMTATVRAFGLYPHRLAPAHVRYFDRKGRAHYAIRRS